MIDTERLTLEPLTEAHADKMFGGLSDEQMYTYIPESPPKSLQALVDRYRNLERRTSPDGSESWLNWIITRKDTHECIGYTQATISGEGTCLLAYLVFRHQWRQGYATEAVSGTIDHVFSSYSVSAIEAFVDTRNLESQKLALRLGFNCEETIIQADHFKGVPSDEYRFRLIRRN